MVSWSELFLIGEWLTRLVMVPIVVMRQSRPATCLAWLLVICFEPFLGLAAYLLFGEIRLGRRRIRRYARKTDLPGRARRLANQAPHWVKPAIDRDQEVLVHVAQRLGGLPILAGNAVELMADTDQVIASLIRDIDAARHHVHLLYYIFANDTTGQQVAAALIRATTRGVQCRVLADAVGSRRMLRSLAKPLVHAGVAVTPMLVVNPLRRLLARMDLRNHRKLAIVDGQVAYTGSQNIVEANYGLQHVGPWQDLTARIIGPSVSQLQAVFLEDWAFETEEDLDNEFLFPPPDTSGKVALQVVPSGPNHPTAIQRDLFVEALHAARKRVIITTPYFVPDEAMFVALRLAALRGVQVDLVIPARSNHPLVDLAGRFYVEQLLPTGVQVHLHQLGLLHAKTLTVDSEFAMLGTANFDIRSFFLNFELNLFMYGQEVAEQLLVQQTKYIAEARRLDSRAGLTSSKLQRLGENLAKVLSPIL